MAQGPEQARRRHPRHRAGEQGRAQQNGQIIQRCAGAEGQARCRHLTAVVGRRAADGNAVDGKTPEAGQADHHQHGGKATQQGEDQRIHISGEYRSQQAPACQDQQCLSRQQRIKDKKNTKNSKQQYVRIKYKELKK